MGKVQIEEVRKSLEGNLKEGKSLEESVSNLKTLVKDSTEELYCLLSDDSWDFIRTAQAYCAECDNDVDAYNKASEMYGYKRLVTE